MIPIALPVIGQEEIDHVEKVMRTGMIASGDVVGEFEKRFAEYIGVPFAVAASSGTTSLHAAVIASGIGAGDKVITTPFTFAASSNCLLFEKAVPVFADIDPETFNIDPDSIVKILKKQPDIKALLIVHLFGLPCDMKRIMEIADRYNLILIEDCAQAHGANINGKKSGSFGQVAAFSFYPTKNMTTGEGGMLVTESEAIYKKLKSIINHGQEERYLHTRLGYNYRLTNIAAAIGIEQLKKLDAFNAQRKINAEFYLENINNDKIVLPVIPGLSDHVFHQFTLRVQNRLEFLKHLECNGIGYGVYYPTTLNNQPYYKDLGYSSSDTPAAVAASEAVVSIPVHPSLSTDDKKLIVSVINDYE